MALLAPGLDGGQGTLWEAAPGISYWGLPTEVVFIAMMVLGLGVCGLGGLLMQVGGWKGRLLLGGQGGRLLPIGLLLDEVVVRLMGKAACTGCSVNSWVGLLKMMKVTSLLLLGVLLVVFMLVFVTVRALQEG